MEFTQEIKIPKDRVSVLIGKKGEIKRLIQKKLDLKLKIDSETGVIILEGDDGLNVYTGKIIVHAIARGFNPEIALTLLEENNTFELIDITEYSKKSKNRLIELKSRVIGTEGRAKKTIEKIANVEICVYGKTIGIIGESKKVDIAKKAIEKLLSGSKHGNVYYFLEKQKQ